jgi:hypothetical protein
MRGRFTISAILAFFAMAAALTKADEKLSPPPPPQCAEVFIVRSNGRAAKVERAAGEKLTFVDEDGRTDMVTIASDGSFKAWGTSGKVLPNGDIQWGASNTWLSFTGFYHVQSNGKIARVEANNGSKLTFTDENSDRVVANIRNDGRFDAWGQTARLAANGEIQWKGNKWVNCTRLPIPERVVEKTAPSVPIALPKEAQAKDDCKIEFQMETNGQVAYIRNTNTGKKIRATVVVTEITNGKSRRLPDKIFVLAAGERAFCGGTKFNDSTYAFTVAGASYE